MGNKFSRRRAIVDERYTRTQGLYQHSNVDPRKLKRLILNGQLAPCFPGAEESALDLDECPICFLFYPSLNRSKCCTKGVCTECFLQIKSPHSTRPTQCPFCKTSSYLVEYRGAKTVEEKGVEQEEEQKVIEAKIRMRQKELHDEEQRTLRNEDDQVPDNVPERFRRNFSNLHGFTLPFNEAQLHDRESTVNGQDAISDAGSDLPMELAQTSGPEIASRQVAVLQGGEVEAVLEGTACAASQTSCQRGSSFQRLNRVDDFDLDLEEIMIMEAIWLSIQEQGQTTLDHAHFPRASNARGALDEDSAAGNLLESRTMIGRGSVTSGLAGAIAALAEMQATSSESNSTGTQVCGGNVQGLENELCSLPSNNHGCGELLNVNVTSQTASVGAISINAGEKTQGNGNIESGYEITQNKNDGSRDLNDWIEVAVQSGRTISPPTSGEGRSSTSDCLQDHSSEAVEVGTSFSSSVPSDLPWEASELFPLQCVENTDDSLGLAQSAMMLPDSFEEQMMLAMALSLAEAQVQAQRH